MGISEESAVQTVAELACSTKPKERQFQVVHVPGVFTRGRWRCWDYKDENPPADAEKLLRFDEDEEGKENDANALNLSGSPSIAALSEPVQQSSHSPQRESSSTILVTSIAPAPPTPQHGTPSSLAEMPTPPYAAVEVDGGSHQWPSPSAPSSITSPPAPQQQQLSQPVQVVTGAPVTVCTSSSTVSPPTTNIPAIPEMTRSVTEAAPVEEESTAVASISNVVAIDNKIEQAMVGHIEQAMDLVKTHLTFAVREEVEILRSTISDLENKVTQLESQNAYLRRHVTTEVLANLPSLVSQHKQSLPATSAPSPAVLQQQQQLLQQQEQQLTPQLQHPPVHSSPAVVPSPQVHHSSQQTVVPSLLSSPPSVQYCPATSNFASTLNTVVPPPPSPQHPR